MALMPALVSKASIVAENDQNTFSGDLVSSADINIVNGSLLFLRDANLISLTPDTDNLVLNSSLSINQQIRIRGGNPANGRVLSSDANGLAEWVELNAAPGGGDFTNFGDTAIADRSFGNQDAFAMDLLTNGISRINASASGDIVFNPNSQNSDLMIQGLNSSDLVFADASANNLSFGIRGADAKLQVNGSMLLGSIAGPNLNFDENGIQASDNSTATTLLLQDHANGRVRIGTNDGAGQLGVGTDDPTASIDINGLLKIRGGNPGANFSLVSDANGVGTWEPITFAGDQGEKGNTGPKGFPGQQGDFGLQGDKGPDGDDGLISGACTTVSRSQTFNSNVTATCPPGTIRTAGGVRCNSPPGGRYIIDRSEPIGFDSWRGRCELLDGGGRLLNIEVRVLCCGV